MFDVVIQQQRMLPPSMARMLIAARRLPRLPLFPPALTAPVRRLSTTKLPDSFVDYYAILEVTPETPLPTIKQQYYALAKHFHPDRTASYEPGVREWATRRWKLIGDAWHVLGDSMRRHHYDSFMALNSVGDNHRIKHWLKVNRPPELLEETPPQFRRQ